MSIKKCNFAFYLSFKCYSAGILKHTRHNNPHNLSTNQSRSRKKKFHSESFLFSVLLLFRMNSISYAELAFKKENENQFHSSSVKNKGKIRKINK